MVTSESATHGRAVALGSMWSRARVLSALEVACFGAISCGVAVAGYVLAGVAGGVASGLITAGGCGVYLVNVYSLPLPEPEETPDD